MMDNLIKSFQLSTLCIAIMCANTSTYALEELEKLDDYELGESTGEGVAFLPENFSMRMNGPDAANQGAGTYDTGYIRLVPVGPIAGNQRTGTAPNFNYVPNYTYNTAGGEVYDGNDQVIQKADVFLYGLGVSESNAAWGAARTSSNWGMGFGNPIDSWGTAVNPWVLKTVTENVQQFASTTDAGRPVTYFSVEAPLYKSLTNATTNGSTYNDVSALSTTEKSAYNLRLNLWSDAFMRNANIAESPLAASATNGLSNQLRLNMVWDGFSVNGSNLKFFRTLDGVTGANTTAQAGLSKAYNQTLGLAATLRLNSGPTHNIRGISTAVSTKSEWVSYDASNIGYRANLLTQTELDQLKAGNYSAIGGSNKVIIADGTGTAASGTVLWNGPEAYRGTNYALANPANPNYNYVIKSYVPVGNSQGNNVMDHDWKDGPYYVYIGGVAVPISVRGYWNYTQSNGLASLVGVEQTGVFLRAHCGNSQGTPGSAIGESHNGPGTQCFNQEGFRVISAEVSAINNWSLPAEAKKSVLRINAADVSALGTPALTGGGMPDFSADGGDNKGIFLYGLNANMVLGSLYQPLIFDTNNGNFTIEVSRIPNDQRVYSQIYTRYNFDTAGSIPGGGAVPDSGVTYLGSTCNIYRCSGSNSGVAENMNLGGLNYQKSTATHSSLTSGATNYNAATNQLFAEKGIGSYGISFGSLENGLNLSSVGRRDYIQTFNVQRGYNGQATGTIRVGEYDDRWLTKDDYRWQNQTVELPRWNGNNNYVHVTGITGCGTGWAGSLPTCGPGTATGTAWYYNLTSGSGGAPLSYAYLVNKAARDANSWTNPWEKTTETIRTQNANYQILGLKSGCLNNCGTGAGLGVGHTIPTTFPTDLTSAQTVSNNLGSAVMDGMLIQHLKITTTGLK